MKNITGIVCLFVFCNFHLHSQITTDDYRLENEILLTKKSELQKEISELTSEIDSLKYLIPETEQEIKECFRELYTMKYGNELGQRVAYSQIWRGMTENMTKDSWGEPDKVEKNVKSYGMFTQWYYGDVIFFFRDGNLIDWEDGPDGKSDDKEFYLNKRK